ncbi:MarR family transcriptional regulator [Streptomyces celluloflavus]|nr:MarR family transcriptional regulator [Streptomyces celluloflavus]
MTAKPYAVPAAPSDRPRARLREVRRDDRSQALVVQIAAHIQVQPDTVRAYRKHGLLPEPDQVEGGRPY